ncbi:hypothetical protein QAD02_009905 [Eretmocerus hayati]|uniref:Uncharacterized protein n=1 Tax=Eretmocerus hayati TaxID=131215 RepID=A0ACC2NAZ4_9HYME|nr:hypothetical protein QAD02_009905 [Eretmocerus hayati]
MRSSHSILAYIVLAFAATPSNGRDEPRYHPRNFEEYYRYYNSDTDSDSESNGDPDINQEVDENMGITVVQLEPQCYDPVLMENLTEEQCRQVCIVTWYSVTGYCRDEMCHCVGRQNLAATSKPKPEDDSDESDEEFRKYLQLHEMNRLLAEGCSSSSGSKSI